MRDRASDPHSTGSPRCGRATAFEIEMILTAPEIRDSGRFFHGWEVGPLSHLTHLQIIEPAPHGFRLSARGHDFGGLLSIDFRSDALTGVSGRRLDRDPIVADLVVSGRLDFRREGRRYPVLPGQICIRDTRSAWRFSCAPATRVRVVSIPRYALTARIGSPRRLDHAHIEDAGSPEVGLFVHFLEALEKSRDDLDRSAGARSIALDSCATLLAGILATPQETRTGADADDDREATLRAARHAIEKHLDRPDLSPALIARALGVSLRTLHRSFSGSNDSVMSFARRLRLQGAHDDLVRTGGAAGVSEIAARWNFSDASHFIRNFKEFYGTTPAAYVLAHRHRDRHRRHG
ncbi:helix-turn-helix domain-containing protein [Streptomyces scabiei]|uniref:helix-turn-helix domain-containing protein n=1 Tax=Streptomyces scabiei TaxID=1930 RepID=UPI00299027F9|nr:helix-turn-helix domain-containing protein [Streptomyces scabiei]MDW8808815.1 helix-turn-helix domain-containing protein [Streptomyces scabiei]